MAPDHHDLVLAITSHLPHLIAYTIVGTADDGVSNQMRQMAGDGEHQIVVIRCHNLHIRAEEAPECSELSTHLRPGVKCTTG